MLHLAQGFKLKEYQEETVEFCLRNKYSIVALDPGLGKTLVSLVVAFKLGLRTMVVCPSFLIPNWVEEINKFFPGKVITIFNASKHVYPPVDSDIVLTTFDIVARNEDVFQYVFEWTQLVVVDEATGYKNMEAKRTEAFHRLLYENSVPRCMLLTGTPIQNRVYELYSLMAACYYNPALEEPEFLNRFPCWLDFADYFSFREDKYVSTKRGRKLVPQWDGFKNIAELKSKFLKDIYIRFKSDDVLKDLPDSGEKFIHMDKIEDDPEVMAAFEEYNEENSSVMPAIKKDMALRTVKFTCKYVESEIDRFENVFIYTDHVESCEEIAKHFGVPPIHGQISVDKRSKILRDFVLGKTKYLVSTIKSFNTGITVINCNWMVFNDLPWVPGDLEQARRRIRRIGQLKFCNYHYIFGSLQSKKILESLQNKEETIREVT